MKAHARLVVDGGHMRVAACEPPLSMRACADAVYLVASAAGPIGGDDLALDVVAEAGTDLVVRSAAASIALPGRGRAPSRMCVHARVGTHASLTWEPEPLVAAAGCDHVTDVHVELAETATLRWREVLVLGRAGEQPGCCRVRLRVDRGGEPVLRHDLVVGAGHDGFAALGRARVVGTLVLIDDAPHAATRLRSGPDVEVAVLPLERGGVLVTVLGDDARAVEAEMGVPGAARYA